MSDSFDPMRSGYENPIVLLARSLGHVQYQEYSDFHWARLFLLSLPSAVPIVVSLVWDAGAPYLLMFAGAVAGYQLKEPYERWVDLVQEHWREAKQEGRSPFRLFKARVRYSTDAISYRAGRPAGYSPLELALARCRFRRLSKRWRSNFGNVDRVIPEDAESEPPAAAIERWRYPNERSGIESILLRFPVFRSFAIRRERMVLRRVGIELVSVKSDSSADLCVRNLSKQLGISYP